MLGRDTQTFYEGSIDDKYETQVLQAIKNVLSSFVDECKSANSDKKENLTFYLYL